MAKRSSDWTRIRCADSELYLPLCLPRVDSACLGEPLVTADDGELSAVLASQTRNGIVLAPWLPGWLSACRTLLGREPRQRFYTKIPGFNVNSVPPALRTFLFETLFQSRLKTSQMDHSSGIQKLWAFLKKSDAKMEPLESFAPPKWPNGKKASLTFTLDVDSDHIFRHAENPVRERLEREGFVGAWYFLTGRYSLDQRFIDELFQSGHEIGWHGHNHDHKTAFVTGSPFEARIAQAKPFFERYQVSGVRMDDFLWSRPLLNALSKFILYDSSFLDMSPFSEAGIGCGTSLPFRLDGNLWEVPISVTGEHAFPRSWPMAQRIETMTRQIETQIELGGSVHILMHPEPNGIFREGNEELLDAIFSTIAKHRDDLWPALPRDLCAWLARPLENTVKSVARLNISQSYADEI